MPKKSMCVYWFFCQHWFFFVKILKFFEFSCITLEIIDFDARFWSSVTIYPQNHPPLECVEWVLNSSWLEFLTQTLLKLDPIFEFTSNSKLELTQFWLIYGKLDHSLNSMLFTRVSLEFDTISSQGIKKCVNQTNFQKILP